MDDQPLRKKAKSTTHDIPSEAPLEGFPVNLIGRIVSYCEPADVRNCVKEKAVIWPALKASGLKYCSTHLLPLDVDNGRCSYCDCGMERCNFCINWYPPRDMKQCGATGTDGEIECSNNICPRCDWIICGACCAPLCPDSSKCKIGYHTGCEDDDCQVLLCRYHITEADNCC